MNFQHIIVNKSEGIATLWLNRPDVHNAFHEALIMEIIHALDVLKKDDDIRVLVLKGKGKSFCSGADLKWMETAVEHTIEENLKDCQALSDCLYSIYSFPKPTIAMVHGSSFGGANGLLSACDFALATDNTTFSLSEVKVGLIPACIAPYVIKRVGENHSKSIMMRGLKFSSDFALKIGLVNFSGTIDQVELEYDLLIKDLMSAGPMALVKTKELILHIVNDWSMKEARIKTAEGIANIRCSKEGQEGMKAFFDKRLPKWIKNE